MNNVSLGKGAAARFKEESRRTGGSNIGGAYKKGSRILRCLPKSKLKGVVVVGKLVILVGSVGATALAVLWGGGAGTTVGERDGRLPAPHSYTCLHHWNNGSNATDEETCLAFCT